MLRHSVGLLSLEGSCVAVYVAECVAVCDAVCALQRVCCKVHADYWEIRCQSSGL